MSYLFTPTSYLEKTYTITVQEPSIYETAYKMTSQLSVLTEHPDRKNQNFLPLKYRMKQEHNCFKD